MHDINGCKFRAEFKTWKKLKTVIFAGSKALPAPEDKGRGPTSELPACKGKIYRPRPQGHHQIFMNIWLHASKFCIQQPSPRLFPPTLWWITPTLQDVTFPGNCEPAICHTSAGKRLLTGAVSEAADSAVWLTPPPRPGPGPGGREASSHPHGHRGSGSQIPHASIGNFTPRIGNFSRIDNWKERDMEEKCVTVARCSLS